MELIPWLYYTKYFPFCYKIVSSYTNDESTVMSIINDAFCEEPLQPYIDKICDELDTRLLISGYQAINQSVQVSNQCEILFIRGLFEFIEKYFVIELSTA